ncbi:MAG: 50S ribosomal protein L18 [Deltaproteobacteria bacterium]|nr:50S ribosomal protein L18 [Deltaproteobacteria bacterium]NTV56348.1 50S ribosomal protein L18 [Deltaproteobacteria bacterium]
MTTDSRAEARLKRKKRVRTKVKGTLQRPRLSVFRTAKHIYAQIIDDTAAQTLVEASSVSKEFRPAIKGKGGNKAGAALVGEFIAKRAAGKGIKQVVFDRSGFLYHGRVKTLAEAARQHGLEF